MLIHDLVKIEIPAANGVGPIGTGGRVVAINGNRILILSWHSHTEYWYPLSYATPLS